MGAKCVHKMWEYGLFTFFRMKKSKLVENDWVMAVLLVDICVLGAQFQFQIFQFHAFHWQYFVRRFSLKNCLPERAEVRFLNVDYLFQGPLLHEEGNVAAAAFPIIPRVESAFNFKASA